MGGGASWLAAAQNTDIDAVVAMAPAETNVSAIAAGENITVPVLVLSGSADAVTSPSDQHEPIYNAAVNSPCRAFVSIEEGGHCGFADPGTLCDLTEFGFSGLSNEEQQALTLAMAVPWLNYFVRDEPSGLDEMSAVAASSPILSLDLSCAMGIAVQKFPFWQIYPNPSQGSGKIENQSCEILTFRVFNGLGSRSCPIWIFIQAERSFCTSIRECTSSKRVTGRAACKGKNGSSIECVEATDHWQVSL
jgi:hypothetical protein